MTVNNEVADDAFTRRVLSTSADKLFDGLKKDESLTDAEIEAKEKNDDYEWRKLLKKLKSHAARFAIWGALVIATIIILALLIISINYLHLIWDDKQALGSLLSNAISFIVGTMMTFCIEGLMKKK